MDVGLTAIEKEAERQEQLTQSQIFGGQMKTNETGKKKKKKQGFFKQCLSSPSKLEREHNG